MVKPSVARKYFMQCQHCWRSRIELGKDAHLSKCGGCQIATYCSKECQKAAWPAHKALCKINSAKRVTLAQRDQTESMKRLRAFCTKHRPSFAPLGIFAFNLRVDVTQCMRDVLYIQLGPNPTWDNKRAETAYLALDIGIVPLEHLEDQAEELREQMKAFHEEHRRAGRESGFTVIFCDESTGLTSACNVGFGKEIPSELVYGRQWKKRLMHALNTGTTF